MRIIKFRGKAKFNNQWVYGYYVKRAGYDYGIIYEDSGLGHDVYPDTVGQYIGTESKNKKEIYEGDIAEGYLCGTDKKPCQVMAIEWQGFSSYDNQGMGFLLPDDSGLGGYIKIIGNIHDNPELLNKN